MAGEVTEEYRVEIRRSRDSGFPAWEALLYHPGREGYDAWSEIRCTYTLWGARIAAKHLLATRVPVEVVRSDG